LGHSSRLLLLVAFFLSGAAALVFELIWTRLLLLSLGATSAAVGAVLGAFMGGMAVGSAFAGRSFLARRDPIITFALLEGWIGLYGLASPRMLRLVSDVPAELQFVCALILLLPATVAMGASLPVLARAFGRDKAWPAAEVGRLYAVNTAGAVLGPLLAVFALFPTVGLTKTLYVAAGADFLVLISVVLARRVLPDLSGSTSDALLPKGERPAILLVAAMAVSGASAMVYEVAWSRTLSLVYGSSIYGVSIMLSTYLLGIAFGSALASFLLRRRTAPISYRVASWLLIGSSGGAYASLLVTRNLPYIFLNLYRSAPERDLTLFIIQFVVAAALMLPATLCLGAMLPAMVAALPSSKTDLGHRVAWLYTANLVGAATGAVLAAGVLLGSFGIELSVRVASLVALTTAILLAAVSGKGRSRAPLTVSTAIGLIILAFNPTGELLVMSFGLYTHPQDPSREPSSLRELVESHRLVYYRDGPTATVAVQKIDRFILLKINGKTDASNGPGDVSTQLMLGHLPCAVDHADRVAVIGWGSGMTAGAILRHPVESVDAFEIEPAVIEASRFFEPGNGKPLDDPRLRLVMGDARSELLRSDHNYDLIVSEPSNPWITGVSNLFTRDFFEILSSKLTPNGIVCQWFHLYGMSEESTRSLLATFRSVFPHALAFKDRDLILLGSQRPIRLSMSRTRSFFEDPTIQKEMASAFIRYPADIIAELSLDDDGMASFSQGAPINTDDNLLLELAAPRSLYRDRTEAIREAMRRHPPAVIETLTDYDSAADVHLELAASYFTAGRKEDALAACLRALAIRDSFEGLKLLGQTLQSLGRIEEAREALEKALLHESEDAQGKRFVQALLRSLDEVTP
jgi:spermidine synthase